MIIREEDRETFTTFILRYGVAGMINAIVEVCNERAKYYSPQESTYSVWADLLRKAVPEMYAEFEKRTDAPKKETRSTRTTTDLMILRHRPKGYTWGAITNIIDVTPRVTIIEYQADTDKSINYAVYVDEKDMHVGFSTFEKAIIYGIARSYTQTPQAEALVTVVSAVLNLK